MFDRAWFALLAAVIPLLLWEPSRSQQASGDHPAASSEPDATTPALSAGDIVGALRWREIGPSSMGGRIVDLAVVESDPNIYYVGTASGGVFKTTNRGITFSPVFDSAGSLSIGDVCIAPSDPSVIWVGTGEHNARNSVSWGDGVYKSNDAGKTWRKVGLEKSFQIGRIAIHPQNAAIVFVGAVGRLWGPGGERGLYKSEDGGESWRQVLAVDEQTGCIDVAISPGDPSVMLAAMYERQRDPYDGGDPGKRWGEGSGLYRSIDGGETWNRQEQGLPTVDLGRIGFDFSSNDPSIVYAIVETEEIGTAPKGAKKPAFMGISGGGNVDAGAQIAGVTRDGPSADSGLAAGDIVQEVDGRKIGSYDALVAEIQRHSAGDKVKLKVQRGGEALEVELTFGERPVRGGSSERAFAASLGGQRENLQDRQGDNGFQTGGVFKSTDAGETWERVNSLNPRPFYYSQIHVDPASDRNLYVLGINVHASRDGGRTFRTAGRGAVHPDHHAMWIDPADPRHILLGCDGGLYESFDKAATWEFVNTLPIGQFYDVDVDSRRLYNVYGGLQDNGSWGGPSALRGRTGPTADDWFPVFGGDGFVCRVDPDDDDVVYYEMQYGRMGRVDLSTGGRSPITPPRIEGKEYRFNWKTPFMLSHHNGGIFYAAGNYVFRSLDRGDDLRIISPELTRTGRGTITALDESPHDPGVLYAGTDDGRLWITRDGGGQWTDLTETLEIRGRFRVSSIECSRHAAGRAYITLDRHYYDDDAPYMLISEDEGRTWKSISASLPPDAGSVHTLREDLRHGKLLYGGCEFGTFVSLDRGESWLSLCTNLPRVAVHEFAQSAAAAELVAGTHGRGIWILDVAPLRELAAKDALDEPLLFEPRQAVLWSGTVGKRLYGSKRFIGDNPPMGALFYYFLPKEAERVRLRIDDAAGKSLRNLELSKDAGKAGLHVVEWDLRRDPEQRGGVGSGVPAGRYRVVFTVGEEDFAAPLQVAGDPEFPAAPTMLEMEEEEYLRRRAKEAEQFD